MPYAIRSLIGLSIGLVFSLLLTMFLAPGARAEEAALSPDQPIHDIARLGSAAEMQKLLKANPAARDVRTAMGSTPLHLAATNPDSGVVKALLAAGADVNARDGEGATPLHMAAYVDKSANATLLLQAGADVNAVTSNGRSVTSLGRKTMANEAVGVISLWMLKGCKPGMKGC